MKDRLLHLLVWWLSANFSGVITASAQNKLAVLRTDSIHLSIREDGTYSPRAWTISPQLRPDEHKVWVESHPIRVAFIAEKDSIVRNVKAGDVFDFVVLSPGKDSAFTRIKGEKLVKPARFNAAYIRAHKGKTFVEIPDVHELINVVFALTKYTRTHAGLIEEGTPYFKELVEYFSPYQNEPIVSIIDTVLTKNEGNYFPLKMDAYAFLFDRKGIVQQSPIYDRVSWGRENTLRPYVAQLQRFADKSNFADFYRKHQPYYRQLVKAYQDSLDVAGMQRWLSLNFPSTRYDSFKIIFSPLVSSNQSANSFEDNGFREAHAHVNFPFPDESDVGFSAEAVNIRDGNIVFTELNHSFINPEAEKSRYQESLNSAFNRLDVWLDQNKPAKNYDNVYACFEEYMNWGLVSLRYVDYAPRNELPVLLKGVEKMMVERRGFKRFAEFNQFLVSLYQKRPSGTTVADLYPQIINWFEVNKI